MGGMGNIKSQLFATPPEGQFQVTPRRRKSAAVTNTILASTVGGTTVLNVAVDASDTLQPNDGLLFDFILATQSAAATGLTITALSFFIEDVTQSAVKQICIGQAVGTTLLPPSAGQLGTILTPQTALWTANDIGFGLEGLAEPVPLADQPLKLTLVALANNPTAGSISLNTKLTVFYRIVHGLQEG